MSLAEHAGQISEERGLRRPASSFQLGVRVVVVRVRQRQIDVDVGSVDVFSDAARRGMERTTGLKGHGKGIVGIIVEPREHAGESLAARGRFIPSQLTHRLEMTDLNETGLRRLLQRSGVFVFHFFRWHWWWFVRGCWTPLGHGDHGHWTVQGFRFDSSFLDGHSKEREEKRENSR